ncbi:MAG: type II secretion system F family protein [Lachnospiraceae bacterium]|nr:type II secretion system F family protein [Lachnospiraceae bacterium]
MILNAAVIIIMILAEVILRLGKAGRTAGKRFFGALALTLCKKTGRSGGNRRDLREAAEKTAIILTVFFAVNLLALAADVKEDLEAGDLGSGSIPREQAGELAKDVVLTADLPDEQLDIEYEIKPRELNDEEAERLLDRAENEVLKSMPGENGSLSHVTKDLVLVRSVLGGEVRVDWDIWDGDIIGYNGEIEKDEAVWTGGAEARLTATLTAYGHKRTRDITVIVFRDEGEMTLRDKIVSELEKYDRMSSTEDELELPDQVDGIPVSWSLKKSGSGRLIMITGLLVLGLLPLLWQERKRKRDRQRTEELKEDYPEFAHEMILYLDCGMSILSAAVLIAGDMKKNRMSGHALYRELVSSIEQIRNGGARDGVWEDFGKRCGLREYIRIGAFMAQFVRTGADNFRETLSDTARESASLRNESIKRKSETAGTRLLGPIVLLLLVVMTAVVFPALYSMSV